MSLSLKWTMSIHYYNYVKGLGKVDQCGVEVDILFLTIFLQLPGSKYHFSGSPFLPEAALAFW